MKDVLMLPTRQTKNTSIQHDRQKIRQYNNTKNSEVFRMALKRLNMLQQIGKYITHPWCRLIQPFTVGIANTTARNVPPQEPQIPPYREKADEPLKLKKARLLYQSRKRGMLENDLLLASFAARYLENMTAEQVRLYDRLINLPSNDWDIFYWATGVKPTPAEFDNEIMQLLKEHVQNKNRESRIRQPNLYSS